MDRPIRLDMFGCGSVGNYAIIKPAREEEAIIVPAVASHLFDKARDRANRYGIAHSFGRSQALLDAKLADAIYIALPNAMHRKWAITALEAGYPVLCEKQVASSAADAAAMVAAAIANGQPLVEALHWRHHPLDNPFLPHLGSKVTITTPKGTIAETPTRMPRYIFQAGAFARIVREPGLEPNPAQMLGGMRIIDAIVSISQS